MPSKLHASRATKRGLPLLVTVSSLLVVIGIGFIGYRLQNTSGAEAAWTTVFQEDFSGTSLSSEWQIDKGTGYEGGPQNGFGTDEIEVMTDSPANLSVANGNLKLTPIRDSNNGWTSGRIETNKVFKPATGNIMHIESRLQFPDVHGAESLGYWPAFWAMGESQRPNRWYWPASGEFDFAEAVNGINKNWSTLHCGYPAQWGGPCNEPNGISNGGVAAHAGNLWGEYHIYGFEWDRSRGTGNDQLRWYVDNILVHTVNQTDPAVKDVWGTMTSHNGYFIIINMAIGGQFPANQGGGPTAATKSGVPMYVDYVKVLNKVGDGSTPTPTPTPTPTTSPTPAPTPTPSGTPTPTPTPNPNPTPTPAPTPTPTPGSGAPSNLRVTNKTNNSLTMAWDSSSTGATSFDILRGEDGVKIASVTGKTFTDVGLTMGTTYVYYVRGGGTTTPALRVVLDGSAVTPSPSPTPAPTPAPTPTPTALTPGDVNGDGRVNALDLSVLIAKDGQNYPAADFNKDGTVGAADMAILLSKWTW